MRSLGRLRELDLTVLYPGHGPEVADPRAKIAEYIEHRMSASAGWWPRSTAASAPAPPCWPRSGTTFPSELRGAAAIAMQAHLERLAEESRLPPDMKD